MTETAISNKVLKLKETLGAADTPKEKADVLIQLLDTIVNSPEIEKAEYISMLEEQAAALNQEEYNAWLRFYKGKEKNPATDADEAIKYLQMSLQIFEGLKHLPGIFRSSHDIGVIMFGKGNYTEAGRYLKQALHAALEDGNEGRAASAYGNLGSIAEATGNYSDALSYYHLALEITIAVNDKQREAVSYHNLGNVYLYQEKHEEALQYYTSALELFEEIGYKTGIILALNSTGGILKIMNRFDEAVDRFRKARQLSEEINDRQNMAYAIGNLGTALLDKGNFADAAVAFKESLQELVEVGDKFAIAMTYNYLGKTSAGLGNFEESIGYLKQAQEMGEAIGIKYVLKDTYNALSETHLRFHNYKEALDYYKQFHETEKSIVGEQTQKQITQLNFQHNLEQKEKQLEIEQLRNVELKRERDRSENLLLNILPAEVAEELKEKGSADAKHFDNVTVLFTDFKGFTTVSERLSPQQLVDELHACFSGFDAIMHKYNIEKIKTVGDAYLAVSGLPLANPNHAEDVVNAAIELKAFMQQRRQKHGDNTFEVRIGVHSGAVVAGIVGVKKFSYDIWGDTVNTAARMEQNSEAGKINVSETTYELVKEKFSCEYRGEIEAKNKGKMKMYFIQ